MSIQVNDCSCIYLRFCKGDLRRVITGYKMHLELKREVCNAPQEIQSPQWYPAPGHYYHEVDPPPLIASLCDASLPGEW